MKKSMLFLLLIWSTFTVYAQKEGNIWYFGAGAGLNFNVSPPTPLTGALNTSEGCASIANATTGALLFYTDGITVWDRNHNPMPGSVTTPLQGDPSSTQSGVIVPKPGSSNLYYVFTTPAQAGFSGNPPAMCYSIVDMNLNGGNGDVTIVNNVIMDSTTEKIAVVGNCDHSAYWVVGHRWNCDSFYAFKLTATGLSAPVKSKTGIVHTGNSGFAEESIGYMKFSPNGKKLGLVTYVILNTVELFDFDFNTGIISNPVTDVIPYDPLKPFEGFYGCSFSPGNSKFYATFFSDQSRIYQYDMSAGTPAAILASRTMVGSPGVGIFLGAVQNGPDGKMYIARMNGTTLDAINNPDAAGAACGYVASALSIAPNTNTLGLPDIVESFLAPVGGTPFQVPPPTAICKGDTVFSPVQSTPNSFSVTPSATVSVNADSSVFAFFPSETTTYKVTSSGGDCSAGDTVSFTVTVSVGPTANFIFDPATPSLEDVNILLRNTSADANTYAWYNSSDQFLSSAVHYSLPNPGEGDFCYTLVAKDAVGCADTVEKCVTVTKKGVIFVPNTFTPNGDNKNDFFGIYGVSIALDNFSVFNRYGQRVFYTTNIDKGWDGTYQSEPCDVGTYYYVVNYRLKGKKETKKGDVVLLR